MQRITSQLYLYGYLKIVVIRSKENYTVQVTFRPVSISQSVAEIQGIRSLRGEGRVSDLYLFLESVICLE